VQIYLCIAYSQICSKLELSLNKLQRSVSASCVKTLPVSYIRSFAVCGPRIWNVCRLLSGISHYPSTDSRHCSRLTPPPCVSVTATALVCLNGALLMYLLTYLLIYLLT